MTEDIKLASLDLTARFSVPTKTLMLGNSSKRHGRPHSSPVDDGGVPHARQRSKPSLCRGARLRWPAARVPVGLLLLVGLANPRYRFSDETGNDLSGLTLLGILPDLPDRLSDPEQASIAAHCVHQIRTMLQISGGPKNAARVRRHQRAAPGDGRDQPDAGSWAFRTPHAARGPC